MSHTYQYPRPALAVDCVVFGVDDEALKVLLIQRAGVAAHGQWALPGGFVHLDETLDEAAARELREESGLSRVFLEQLYTFGQVDRDPRERVVSVAYFALVRMSDHQAKAATDAADARWARVRDIQTPSSGTDPPMLLQLAFDHGEILDTARQRLRNKVRYQPLGFELLPEKFTLRQLQHLYEVVLERPLDKRNFRRKILGMNLLEELAETEQGVAHRAARLYRFDHDRYERLSREGLNFEV
ncbi:MAG: NUDIX hydrolase [Planctomycetales bacterium]|nr:NUDIX hydrolase [Planctomycetales bacterium]